MAQKSGNNQKKHTDNHQNNKKKTKAQEVPETPVKKNLASTNAPIPEQLSPLPFPPKPDYVNHYIYSSNYSYSNQYVQINTPLPHQTHKIIQNIDYILPAITSKIEFQSESQDQQNNSSSQQSSFQEDLSLSVVQSHSQDPSAQPQESNKQQASVQPFQNRSKNFQKQVKTTNKSSKARTNGNQTIQVNSNKKVSCNCKKTKCLKLYCDCFRLNQTCQGCNCEGCHNLDIYEDQRTRAIISLMDRNPDPFGQKIEDHKHVKGCNCKKSNCQKKYCECYQAGLQCGQNCKCEDCKNMPSQKGGPQGDKNALLTKNTAKKQRKMVQM